MCASNVDHQTIFDECENFQAKSCLRCERVLYSGLCNVNHIVHCNEAEIDGCQTNLGCQPLDVIVITLHTLLLRFTEKT